MGARFNARHAPKRPRRPMLTSPWREETPVLPRCPAFGFGVLITLTLLPTACSTISCSGDSSGPGGTSGANGAAIGGTGGHGGAAGATDGQAGGGASCAGSSNPEIPKSCWPAQGCNPVNLESCGAEACSFSPPGAFTCRSAGTALEGESCSLSKHCADGLGCDLRGGSSNAKCWRWCCCDQDCLPAGGTCERYYASDPMGYCR